MQVKISQVREMVIVMRDLLVLAHRNPENNSIYKDKRTKICYTTLENTINDLNELVYLKHFNKVIFRVNNTKIIMQTRELNKTKLSMLWRIIGNKGAINKIILYSDIKVKVTVKISKVYSEITYSNQSTSEDKHRSTYTIYNIKDNAEKVWQKIVNDKQVNQIEKNILVVEDKNSFMVKQNKNIAVTSDLIHSIENELSNIEYSMHYYYE